MWGTYLCDTICQGSVAHICVTQYVSVTMQGSVAHDRSMILANQESATPTMPKIFETFNPTYQLPLSDKNIFLKHLIKDNKTPDNKQMT